VSGESSNDADYEQLGVRDCEQLPPGLPTQFYVAPVQVGVSLILTEWNCVYRGFFDDFAVSSLPAAVQKLKNSDGVTLCYNFYFSSHVPAFKFDVDASLYNYDFAEKRPFKRTQVQAAEPWHWCWDRTLFEIRYQPLYEDFFNIEPFEEGEEIDESFDPYAGEYYLRVGGRTKKDAGENWDLCSRVIKKYIEEES